MADFTSGLYLGLRHPSRSLRPWTQLTEGVPAALRVPAAAPDIARRLAALTGVERVVLAPSSFHAFWDVFGTAYEPGVTIYLDAGAYAIAGWGADRAAARGARIRRVPHHDPTAFGELLDSDAGSRPLLVVDGFCPGCGRSAPLKDYRVHLRRRKGLLVIDDTQALGVLGGSPDPSVPYGYGGGGSLRHQGIPGRDILLVGSLAKAFGVPMAMVGGDAPCIEQLEREGDTRVHCSPPSYADLHAAEAALTANEIHGDGLRARVLQFVRRFRQALLELGLRLLPTLFPVQSVMGDPARIVTLHRGLDALGVRSVLQRPACRRTPSLTFLITAAHADADGARLVSALRQAMKPGVPGRSLTAPAWT